MVLSGLEVGLSHAGAGSSRAPELCARDEERRILGFAAWEALGITALTAVRIP